MKEHEAPVDARFSSSSSLSAATEAVMGYVMAVNLFGMIRSNIHINLKLQVI